MLFEFRSTTMGQLCRYFRIIQRIISRMNFKYKRIAKIHLSNCKPCVLYLYATARHLTVYAIAFYVLKNKLLKSEICRRKGKHDSLTIFFNVCIPKRNIWMQDDASWMGHQGDRCKTWKRTLYTATTCRIQSEHVSDHFYNIAVNTKIVKTKYLCITWRITWK